MLENTGQKIVSSVFQHLKYMYVFHFSNPQISKVHVPGICVTILTCKISIYVKVILKSRCNLTKIGQFEKVIIFIYLDHD